MGAARRPLLLIVNPAAGGKPASTPPLADDPARLEPEALAAALRSRGLSIRCHVLTTDDDPAALARAAAAEEDVVVAGGDGTVGPVAAVLAGSPAALGILAMGSWNNIARGLRLPTDLEPALDAIGRGEVARADVGLAWHDGDGAATPPAEARSFFEAAGVGLDAVGFAAAQLQGRAGTWAVVRSLWRGLRRRRSRMVLELDGREIRTRAPAVTVCNGPYHGLGFALVPGANPSDGMLDVVVFLGMSRLDVVRHFLAVARRRTRREPRMWHLYARRITIRGERRALPAHADGTSLGVTPVTFTIDPGSLRVFR